MVNTDLYRAAAGTLPGVDKGAKTTIRVPNENGIALVKGDIVELQNAGSTGFDQFDFQRFAVHVTAGNATDCMTVFAVALTDVSASDPDALFCLRGKVQYQVDPSNTAITRTNPQVVMDSAVSSADDAAISWNDATSSGQFKCIGYALSNTTGTDPQLVWGLFNGVEGFGTFTAA